MRIVGIIVLFLSICFISGCGKQPDFTQVSINVPPESPVETSDEVQSPADGPAAPTNMAATSSLQLEVSVPAELELDVPFAPQAPFGNWDELHQEACEEASMIMVSRYFNNQPLDQSVMETEIQQLVVWEEERGYQVDLTAEETVKILADYFNLSARVDPETTVDRIKYELSLGNLMIIPAAGRQLGNPYFQTPGPIYHMLVVKGYDNDEFITNDVGTKRGDGFRYKYDRLISAIHDWDHQSAEGGMTDEEIARGRRVLIVIEKPN